VLLRLGAKGPPAFFPKLATQWPYQCVASLGKEAGGLFAQSREVIRMSHKLKPHTQAQTCTSSVPTNEVHIMPCSCTCHLRCAHEVSHMQCVPVLPCVCRYRVRPGHLGGVHLMSHTCNACPSSCACVALCVQVPCAIRAPGLGAVHGSGPRQ